MSCPNFPMVANLFSSRVLRNINIYIHIIIIIIDIVIIIIVAAVIFVINAVMNTSRLAVYPLNAVLTCLIMGTLEENPC